MWLCFLEGENMTVKVLSSLEKVFPDADLSGESIQHFSMLGNERLSFQIAVRSSYDCTVKIGLSGRLSGVVNLYEVKDVHVELTRYEDSDDYYIDRGPGMYPDVLVPVNGEITLEADRVKAFWAEVVSGGKISGFEELEISVGDENVKIGIDIIDALFPEQELIYTNWYHSDCLCDYYGVEAMSDEYWRINENFIGTAASHGVNCILTPLFTPPLDMEIGGERTTVQLVKVTKTENGWSFDLSLLDKWIDVCRKCGIRYFEMSHFFTQWGALHAPKIMAYDESGNESRVFGWDTPTDSAEYDEFLTAFGEVLCSFIEEKGLGKNIFFHISDEPSLDNLETYEKRASLIKKVFGKYPVMDALSNYDFYKRGTVDIPVPGEGHIEEFAGRVPELWTYYCCGQHNRYLPNRFIAMPSLRSRIIGFLAYKYNLSGFLQWGYNFYNSQYSKERINPFECTDARGAFPAGDAFVVYPAPDGTAYPSIRLKVIYEAFQDIGVLKTLEGFIGREKVLELIGDISFTDYPHSESLFLEIRETVNSLIKKNASL